jgi:hypothetical protein
MATSRKSSFSLTVPIEASQTPDTAAVVKVAIVDDRGRVVQSQLVKTGGKPSATFDLAEVPRNARVVVGPEDADDASLAKLDTVTAAISPRVFQNLSEATLNPIIIPPIFWPRWRRFCRDFTITGTVICANGRPVPGAQVCAFDVDWFWIWQSKQQIGCATTDQHGNFTINFRWCCGWYPWWWWYLRNWQLDLRLAEEVIRVLPPELKVKPIPLPDPVPDLRMIESLIPPSRLPKNLKPFKPIVTLPRLNADAALSERGNDEVQAIESLKQSTNAFFERAETLRPVLANLIPPITRIPDLWPWFPWYPWLDCNPDVIFTVTQFCGSKYKVVLDQDYSQTQWNIDTSHNVTLVANNDACCLGEETPCGDPCLSISQVCGYHRTDIDQTTGSVTAGFAEPGGATAGDINTESDGDRPFAGAITVYGPAQCMGDDVDYYEVEYGEWNGSSFNPYTPVPITSLAAFTRTYFTASTTPPFTAPQFAPTPIDGKTVYPSRKKIEATLPVPNFCYADCQILFIWNTNAATWSDGTYRLRLRAYKEGPPGTLVEQILGPCHPDERNEIIVTLDNRLLPDPFHVVATTPDHPCGAGTVHLCTTEPDVDIETVRLIRMGNPTPEEILPCHIYERRTGDQLQIDFLVSDRSEHLGYYELNVKFGENQIRNLLIPGNPLTPLDPGVAVGPTYFKAIQPVLNQGATAPNWRGGRMQVTIPMPQRPELFPDPCCYQVELYARKRTIVSCTAPPHDNIAEYSFFY